MNDIIWENSWTKIFFPWDTIRVLGASISEGTRWNILNTSNSLQLWSIWLPYTIGLFPIRKKSCRLSQMVCIAFASLIFPFLSSEGGLWMIKTIIFQWLWFKCQIQAIHFWNHHNSTVVCFGVSNLFFLFFNLG